MIIEIEYYKGNAVPFGKRVDRVALRRLLSETEQIGDLDETLCGSYGFERIADDVHSDPVYDRDTGRLYEPKG